MSAFAVERTAGVFLEELSPKMQGAFSLLAGGGGCRTRMLDFQKRIAEALR